MAEPKITCPKCKAEIKLTESLAAPLIASTKRQYEKRLSEKDNEISKREQALEKREEAIAKEKESIEDEVAERLKAERQKITVEESKKAKLALSIDRKS